MAKKKSTTPSNGSNQIAFDFSLIEPVEETLATKRKKKTSIKKSAKVKKADQVFVPSEYQSVLFEAVRNGIKAIAISSVPGSGKTTTIKELVPSLPASASVLLLAFNRHAAAQLKKKINELKKREKDGVIFADPKCKTIHGVGYDALVRAYSIIRTRVQKGEIFERKYRLLCREYLASSKIYDKAITEMLVHLVDKVRLSGKRITSEITSLCEKIEDKVGEYQGENEQDPKNWKGIRDALFTITELGATQARDFGTIDFTDMIWLPLILDLPLDQYDYVCVDEAQDLSPTQLELVLKAWNKKGTFIAVGDRHQSIYAFAGASSRSIDEIIEKIQAVEMDLPVCYRCPQSVVDLAASIYPGITAFSESGEGSIQEIDDSDVLGKVLPGDLILCRYTAPLIEMCHKLLREGKKAIVRGRDIGKSVGGILSEVQRDYRKARNPLSVENLEKYAESYRDARLRELCEDAEENATEIANLIDRIDTLICLCRAYRSDHNAGNIEEFRKFIDAFFKDSKGSKTTIVLSTGHKAKGLENPRVFILGYNRLVDQCAQRKGSDAEQEENLRYVMVTRVLWDANNPHSGTLFLCNSED
jgi:DNA helicase-2/ATP-dependent DNA helicase PcrA